MGLQRRFPTRVALASATCAVLVAACGPSDQALFEEALAEGREALAADALELAEERLSAAGTLRPNDTEFLAAWQSLFVIVASRDLFLEAERLADSGRLLAARDTFLQVSETDIARFGRAQAAALSVETRWLDDTAATLDDLLSAKNLIGVVLAVDRARQAFPAPALERQVIEPRAEQALQALADVGLELIVEGQLSNIDNLIQRITTIFPLSDSEASAAVRDMSELATSERARIARVRSEEAARRKQEALQALQPRRPATPPASGDCPSPVTDPAGFQRCMDARLAGVGRVPVAPPIQMPAVPCFPDFSNPKWQDEFHRCFREREGDTAPPLVPSPSPVLPTPPAAPPTASACPQPRARIVLTALDASIQGTGAISATLSTSIQGRVENQSSGILAVTGVLYEFRNAAGMQAVGVLNWSGGDGMIQPGSQRSFSVENASHPVTGIPNFLTVRLLIPTLLAPTADLNAQCPAQTLEVNDSFGTFTTPVNFR